jgi:DUF971 family protein
MNTVPVQFEIKSEAAEVRITWDDDHLSVYSMRYLRGYCPCAKCQGHGGRWDFVPVDTPVLTAVEEVGNYALRIIWDGAEKHTTGIYSFDNLRELCPCDACRTAAGPSHPFTRM